MSYSYKNSRGTTYFLNKREVTLRGSGKKQTIFFFSKDDRNGLDSVPDGYEVKESQRTGLPVLKRK